MTVHVVGAGLAGLAAAWAAARAGHRVVIHEAARQAGGRCRGFADAGLGRKIDNGTHVVLGANQAALEFFSSVGSPGTSSPAADERLPFLDVASGIRWTVDVGRGALGAVLSVGGARALAGLLRRPRGTVAACYGNLGPVYDRFIEPFALATLNRPLDEAPAEALLPVLWRLAFAGRGALRPHLARRNIADDWIDPALSILAVLGAEIRLQDPLSEVEARKRRIISAAFRSGAVTFGEQDALILALPPWALEMMAEAVPLPRYDTQAIVCAHFLLSQPASLPEGAQLMGLTGGRAQWLACRGEVLSVTVSAAGDLMFWDSEDIAQHLWRDAAAALGNLEGEMPPHRVIKERRATAHGAAAFGPRSDIGNLFFAGGWTQAPLPDTIEAAVFSGISAASCLSKSV
ncbi:MAG TPA: FAD-dependent oxidoreductase [Alphaproteobacteria bacterium]|nr:FAD-dependent oxidoreductase [Alphaproteobacteria bacterium]